MGINNDIPMGEPPQESKGQPKIRAAIPICIGASLNVASFYRAAEQRLPSCEEDLW